MPAQAKRYSNSGYIFLSAAISDITDQRYQVAVYNLVLAQSTGWNIRLPGPDSSLVGVVQSADPVNEPTEDIREPRGAEIAVASPESMALFLSYLLSGRILEEETVAQMLEDLYLTFDNGLSYRFGLMVYDVPGETGSKMWIGHSGGAPGARLILVFPRQSKAFLRWL